MIRRTAARIGRGLVLGVNSINPNADGEPDDLMQLVSEPIEPVADEPALLFCKCGGLLSATVALLAHGLVEMTGIGCRKCQTLTPVRRGVMDTREAVGPWGHSIMMGGEPESHVSRGEPK
jgi:hypothetical protein